MPLQRETTKSCGGGLRRLGKVLRALGAALPVLCYANGNGAELSALTENLPPLNYQEDGEFKGYATELLRSMLTQAKLSASFQQLPWTRAYRTAKTTPNTILYSTVRTEERESLFYWIGPFSKRCIYLFRRKERNDIRLNTLDDARKYRIGVVRGMAATTMLMKSGFSVQTELDVTQSEESNIRKLFAGRVDLILALDWSAYYQAAQIGRAPDELVPVLLVDGSHSYYFALNKKSDPAVVSALAGAFEKLRRAGELEQLKKKYLPR